jgi:hypothetical protein
MINIDKNDNRLGVYQVDNISFVNKFDALKFATEKNKDVYWNFNDAVYSSLDWSIPIETSLFDLYKQRAQQLRDKYDYLSLFYSGGVDSNNVLHSFIDNNIFLDEIVIYRPASQVKEANMQDLSVGNIWSEIEFAAIPYLKQHVKNEKTLIRIIDLEDCIETFFNSSNFLSQWYQLNYLSPFYFAKNSSCMTDPHWTKIYNSGKSIGHITGTDKPIIKHNKGKYTFQFNDVATSISHFEPQSLATESDMIKKHQCHEFFYWTPELPQLLIKQCQVVKKVCENDFLFKLLFTYDQPPLQDRFLGILNHIYPSHVNSIRNLFTTYKPTINPSSTHHQWIQKYCSTTTVGKFNNLYQNSINQIDSRFFFITDLNFKKNSNFKIFLSKSYTL